MSFCRFEDDCDVHAFDHGEGFTVVVANTRLPVVSDESINDMGLLDFWRYVFRKVEPIGGPCDGQTLEFNTPQELVDGLLTLQEQGYRLDSGVWHNILNEYPDVNIGTEPVSDPAVLLTTRTAFSP